jgi:hypothetical protein
MRELIMSHEQQLKSLVSDLAKSLNWKESNGPLERIGFLVEGFFYCEGCCRTKNLVVKPTSEPQPIPIYRVNIGQYSQRCSQCRKILIDGWLSRGEPLSLFPVKDLPPNAFALEEWLALSNQIITAEMANDLEDAFSLMHTALHKFLLSIFHEIENKDLVAMAADMARTMARLIPKLDPPRNT